MKTIKRSYNVETNDNPLTRGTRPWKVVCSDDSWFIECRTYARARNHADMLNIHDTAAVSLSAKAMEARS